MALSVNYPQPVTVNGYVCRNCTEVDLARKNIDPAHPKSGPGGADAASDPTLPASDPRKLHAEEKAAARGKPVPGAGPSAGHGDPAKGRLVDILA